ncbi:inosine monophosphate dehydrogenase [Aspergillus sclerotioniger CBS 115572]|uniref:Inosine monophosphate dehydrogenase n=1 Tax=Aspergillus sclerotioniger CBS 115572 TaxID=1450535 RepID=A0A317XBL4_9EURO|nr:inosine monophosphate dehydrogenase [Aspergillus sclerotioniger CBS 115572]PWY95966.1 inosine monophosphate dehydrogenase [Aspergillus sclerotioniger CBS 115572]
MSNKPPFQKTYPWTSAPIIAQAPMLNIAGPELATAVSAAGGIGFVAGGNDVSNLERKFQRAEQLIKDYKAAAAAEGNLPTNNSLQFYNGPNLPIGVGFLNWGADIKTALPLIIRYRPCAVWLFAPPNCAADQVPWVEGIRAQTSGSVAIWAQVGSVEDAVDAVAKLHPDVLVVQGSDGGGHGLEKSASIVSLVPEVIDKLCEDGQGNMERLPRIVAAGGLVDGRGVAAALVLGAEAVVMGTRFLASSEAGIQRGYQEAILEASDGGVCTIRSTVYDRVRGFRSWPGKYSPRGIVNRTHTELVAGKVSERENYDLYQKALEQESPGYGANGRLATFAGTAVGLVREVLPAGEIVRGVRKETEAVLRVDRVARL